MKKILFLFMIMVIGLSANAQDNTTSPGKVRELGFAFSGLNNFGLFYKTGSQKAVFRIQTLVGTGYSSTRDNLDYENTSHNYNLNLEFGVEWRKPIVQNFDFRFGGDVMFGFQSEKSKISETTELTGISFRPGVNLVLGFQYVIKNKLVLGIEMLPYFSYETGTYTYTANEGTPNESETKTTATGTHFGLSSSTALLSVAFRF